MRDTRRALLTTTPTPGASCTPWTSSAAQIDPWAVVVAAVVHPSTNYVIFRERIFSANSQFMVRRYDGPDPHDSHIHISILRTSSAERAARHWLVR